MLNVRDGIEFEYPSIVFLSMYMSLFRKIILIILQHMDVHVFQSEIQGACTKLSSFKAYRGHPSKVAK